MTNNNNHKTELPAGWVWTTVDDITQPIEKVNPKEKPDEAFIYLDISSIDNKAFRIVEPKSYLGVNAPSRARQLVKARDVLFSTVRTYLMNIASVPEIYDGQICSTGFSVLRTEKNVSPQYLFYYALTPQFLTPLEKLQRGTSYPAVRDNDVRAQPFPLPPLAEQQRIVDKIEELFSDLDHSVAALEKARAQLDIYRQAVLKHAFEGKLTEPWRQQHRPPPATDLLAHIQAERQTRYQQDLDAWQAAVAAWESQGQPGRKPAKPKKPQDLPPLTAAELAELPSLPEGWKWVSLGKVSYVSGGLTKNSKRQSLDLKAPYLRVANVYANQLDLDDVQEIGIKESELERTLLCKNDLLIVEGNGSIDQIGRVALWNDEIKGCVHQNHIIKARPLSNFNSKFLLYFLLSRIGRDFIIRVASSTSGLHTLSLSKVANLNIPVCSLAEQRAIVDEIEARLSVVDKLAETIDTALHQAEALRQSILKQAFAGKLVPQNAADEPAEVLLERIKRQ